MLFEILKGIIVGICASAPLGPVAMLVIRKTIRYDRRIGTISGLGCTFVDTLYAIIGVFAVSAVEDFLNANNFLVSIVGGIVVIVVGATMAMRNPFRREIDELDSPMLISHPAQSAGLALANPGALALMLALLAMFDINAPKLVAILSITLGSVIWWVAFAFIINKVRLSLKVGTLVVINRLLGSLVVLFGIIWIVKVF